MERKRPIDSLSDIKDEESEVELDFAVEGLSSIKKGQSGNEYYDGIATDESEKLRFVGFDPTSRQKIAEIVQKKKPIRATNCAIKRSQYQRDLGNLEIHINESTTIAPSPKKIKFQNDSFQDVSIASINDISVGTTVNVTAKVVSSAPVRSVSTGRVQDVTITDDTGSISLSLWDNNIDTLKTSTTYSFSNLSIQIFQNKKVLQFGQRSLCIPISNDVELNAITEEKVMRDITNATIIGTQNFQFHYLCVNCGNNMECNEDTFIRCSKCDVFQQTKSCRLEASIRILFQTESDKIFLSVFTDNLIKLLREIAAEDWQEFNVSRAQESLLSTNQKFNIKYTTNEQVQSIVIV